MDLGEHAKEIEKRHDKLLNKDEKLRKSFERLKFEEQKLYEDFLKQYPKVWTIVRTTTRKLGELLLTRKEEVSFSNRKMQNNLFRLIQVEPKTKLTNTKIQILTVLSQGTDYKSGK
jgi:hypothetical protein